jgi:hypothetical protein
MPFINTVSDKPTGNAAQGVLFIGKNNISLQIPFTLLVSDAICTYHALCNKMSGLTAEYAGQQIQRSRCLGVGASMGCRRLLQCEHFEKTLCHLLE